MPSAGLLYPSAVETVLSVAVTAMLRPSAAVRLRYPSEVSYAVTPVSSLTALIASRRDPSASFADTEKPEILLPLIVT